MQNCGRGESDAEDKTRDSSGTRKSTKAREDEREGNREYVSDLTGERERD